MTYEKSFFQIIVVMLKTSSRRVTLGSICKSYIVSLQKIVCEKGDTLKLAGRAGSIEGCGAAAERGGGLLRGAGCWGESDFTL